MFLLDFMNISIAIGTLYKIDVLSICKSSNNTINFTRVALLIN